MLEIAVQTLGFYEESKPRESMRFIHECGFEAIEYNINDLFRGDALKALQRSPFFDQSIEELQEYFKGLKEAAAEYQVKIGQMHAPYPYFCGTPEYNAYLLSAMEKILAVTAYLECPKLVIHPYNFEMIRQMIPMAKKYGVMICIENLYDYKNGHTIEDIFSNVEDVCRYIDALNEEAGEEVFGCCFDIGHANIIGRNLEKYVKTLGNRLKALHIHETVGTSDAHMIPYTQYYCYNRQWSNWTDWDGFLEGLRAIQYKGEIAFETGAGIMFLPEPVRGAGYQLIHVIGRYFRERILA